MSENVFDKISGIPVASGFKLQAKAPLDPRQVVDTIEDRNALITENGAYEGMQVYVKADKKTYCLKDLTAGTWEEVGAGGGLTAQYEEFTFTSFSNYQEVTGTPTYYQIDFNSADLESYIEFFTRNYEKGLTLSVIQDGEEVMQFPLALKSDMYWGSTIVSYADIIGLTVFGNYHSLQLRGFSIYDNIENVVLIKEVFQGLVAGVFQLKIRTAGGGSKGSGGGSSSGKYLHCLSVRNVINNILYSALIPFVDNNITAIYASSIFERLNPQSLMLKQYNGSGSVMNAENKILGVIDGVDFMGQSVTTGQTQQIRFLYKDTGTESKHSDWFNPDDTNFVVFDTQLAL